MITVGSGDDAVRYFIDMGTQSMEKMKNLGIHPDTVRSIFITHMHGDHTNGLIPYVDICSWYYTRHPFEVYLPEIAGADALKAWVHATCRRAAGRGRIPCAARSENPSSGA